MFCAAPWYTAGRAGAAAGELFTSGDEKDGQLEHGDTAQLSQLAQKGVLRPSKISGWLRFRRPASGTPLRSRAAQPLTRKYNELSMSTNMLGIHDDK